MASKLLLTLALWAALLIAGPTGFGPGETYAQGCVSQGEARAAIANGQARPFSQFSGRLRSMGDVVSSCLVDRGGGTFDYVVSIVQSNGQVTNLSINARTGQ